MLQCFTIQNRDRLSQNQDKYAKYQKYQEDVIKANDPNVNIDFIVNDSS